MAQGPPGTGGSGGSGVLQTLQTSRGCTEPEQRGLCGALLGWAAEELMSLRAPKIPPPSRESGSCRDPLLGTRLPPTKLLSGVYGGPEMRAAHGWRHVFDRNATFQPQEKGKSGIPQRAGTELMLPGSETTSFTPVKGPRVSSAQPLAAHQDPLLQTVPQIPPQPRAEPRAGFISPLPTSAPKPNSPRQ